jgi:hypothetical protein
MSTDLRDSLRRERALHLFVTQEVLPEVLGRQKRKAAQAARAKARASAARKGKQLAPASTPALSPA